MRPHQERGAVLGMLGLFWVLVILAVAALLAGCGVGPDKSREDAVDTKDVDKSAPHVIAFNNRFPNVATKCDGHGHRVYVATSGYVKFFVLDDADCR